jgi:two-component system NtrC family sensor kinase
MFKRLTIFKKLGSKLIIFISLIVLVAVGFIAFFVTNLQKKHLIDEVIKGASRVSETVKRSTRYDMLKYEPEDVHEIINTIGEQQGIEKIRIFNKIGVIIYSNEKEEMLTLLDKEQEECYACHAAEKPLERLTTTERTRIYRSPKGYRVLGMINPIYNEPDCYSAACHTHPETQKILGVLDINMSLAQVDKTISRNRSIMLIFTFAVLVPVILVSGIFIQRFVNRPVRELLIGTQKIADGNLRHEIPVYSDDEIGMLARSFNKMTDKLKTAHQEIENRASALQQKVDELKKTQQQLIRSAKLASLGKLAAGVAHEINNPLAIILNYCYLLMRRLGDQEAYGKNLKMMISEVTRCSRIVKSLLDFAREAPPEMHKVDLNRLIEHSLTLMKNQSAFFNIKVIKDFDNHCPQISADADQLEQVFMNVILNAAEAMSEGGSLIIKTAEKNGYVEVRFSDTGCGIKQKDISKIFDPFYSTKEVGKGIGLGLSVSYGIMERHNGSIEVASSLHKGTTFILKFPLEETEIEEVI